MNNILHGIYRVFSDKKNIITAIIIAVIIFILADIITNYSLVWFSLTTPIFSFSEKMIFLFRTLISLNSQLTPLSILFLVVISLLAGIHLTLFKYYYQHRIVTRKVDGGGFVGLVVGIIGLGCGSCGSVVLSSILGVTATSQLIGVLPLQGIEFSLLAIVIIIFSIGIIGKKISDPHICPIK